MFEIEVKNFLNFKDLLLNLNTINVITGENKTGKTNLSKLIYLMVKYAGSYIDDSLIKEEINLLKIDISKLLNYYNMIKNFDDFKNLSKKYINDEKIKLFLDDNIDFILNNQKILQYIFFIYQNNFIKISDIKSYLSEIRKDLFIAKDSMNKLNWLKFENKNLDSLFRNSLGKDIFLLKNKIWNLDKFIILFVNIFDEIIKIINGDIKDDTRYKNLIFLNRCGREFDATPSQKQLSNYLNPLINVNENATKAEINFQSSYNVNFLAKFNKNSKDKSINISINAKNLVNNINNQDKLNVYYIDNLPEIFESIISPNTIRNIEQNLLDSMNNNLNRGFDLVNSNFSVKTFLHKKQIENKYFNINDYYENKKLIELENKNKEWYEDTDYDFINLVKKINKNDNIIPFQSLSSGEKSKGIIIKLIKENFFTDNSIIIFDEFEKHFDPRKQKECIKILIQIQKLTNCKYIFSTHSPFVITAIDKFSSDFNLDKNDITWNYFKIDKNNNSYLDKNILDSTSILDEFEKEFVY